VGLGFDKLSAIDFALNSSGDAMGHSLLYNMFSQNLSEPNYIAFSLQRTSDPTDNVQGTFLIGEVDSNYTAVTTAPPIATFPDSNPSRWTVILDALLIGSKVVEVASTVPDAPSNQAVVLVDTGSSYSYGRVHLRSLRELMMSVQLRPVVNLRCYLWKYS